MAGFDDFIKRTGRAMAPDSPAARQFELQQLAAQNQATARATRAEIAGEKATERAGLQAERTAGNVNLLGALGGDALAFPAMAAEAQGLAELPTDQAVVGLEGLQQRGFARTPTFAAQQAAVAEAANLDMRKKRADVIRAEQGNLPQIEPLSPAEEWLGFRGATFPAGMVPVKHPVTGQNTIMPMVGGAQFKKEETEMRATERAIENLNLYRGMVDEAGLSGTEMIGGLATKMNTLRGQIEADILVARGYGAPQAAELERVEAAIPDPTGFWRNLAAVTTGLNPMVAMAQKRSIMAGIDEQVRIIEDVLMDMQDQSFYVQQTPGVINPQRRERGRGR